jgi:chorismate mutase/prephenate dehydratase
MFTIDHQKPGALCDALAVFKEIGLNLTKLDSRPNLQCMWEYIFFIEVEGNISSNIVQKAIHKLVSLCKIVKVLGSF